ncbi:Nuclear transport factor 2, partial [Ascosphaera atra]
SLPFSRVAHKVSTLDAQPSTNGGILVLVTGALLVRIIRLVLSLSFTTMQVLTSMIEQVDEEGRPMNYTQTFHLLPDGQGSFFVFNDIFRLVYGL